MSEGYGRANNKLRVHAGDYLSPDEMRMDWQEAVTLIDEIVDFYTEQGAGHLYDKQDYETVQTAWARIKQG